METSTRQYQQAVSVIKQAILQSQYRAAKLVTGKQLSLYFGIGGYVSYHSRRDEWGTSSIDKISEQLQRNLPGLRGFSARSIRNMRTFFEFWAQYLIWSPTATKLQPVDMEDVIDIDALSIEKWSPLAIEINREEFLGISFSHHLEIYMKVLDDKIRKPHENPTIGILLCKSADKAFVEYVIRDYNHPMGVATYKTADDMDEKLRKALPDIDEMRNLLNGDED